MRSGFGQVQERALAPAPVPAPAPLPVVVPTIKEIPYDYVATFRLSGTRAGNRVQDVINISVEGAFVAVAIGYSFIPAQQQQLDPIPLSPAPNPPDPQTTTIPRILGELNADMLKARRTPIDRDATVSHLERIFQSVLDPNDNPFRCLLVKLCGIDFLYSIIDSGTGRELQNQAIHNIAGLGKADGDRPFRPLAKPMLFLPRSTIRIEVEEISVGRLYEGARLFIVLHGYKMLGTYGTTVP